MGGGGAFSLSVIDASVRDVVSVGLHVLLWVCMEGPSVVDVINLFIEAVQAVGVSLTFTNYERQPSALLWEPDIHSNVML